MKFFTSHTVFYFYVNGESGAVYVHHPNDKLIQIELLSLILAIVIGTIAFIKGVFILIIAALFLIFCSLLSNALLLWHTFQHVNAYKQFARALAVFILTCWILFYL